MVDDRKRDYTVLKLEHARGDAAMARAQSAVERFQAQPAQQAAQAAHRVRQPETRTLTTQQIAGYMAERGHWKPEQAAEFSANQTRLADRGQHNQALLDRQTATEWIRKSEWREEAKTMSNDDVARRWAALSPSHEQAAAQWQRSQTVTAEANPTKANEERMEKAMFVLEHEHTAARKRHEQSHSNPHGRDD